MDGVIASYDFGKPLDFANKRPLITNIKTLEKVSHLKNVELHILSVCRKKREIKDKNDWLDKVEEENLIFSLEGKHLGLVNDKLHCTFKYHPTEKEIFNNLVGEYFDIYLVGYGNNNRNSAFMITLPEELKEYYINYDTDNRLKVPHITVSLYEGASANNSKDLDFKALDEPIKVRGRFGYFIKDNCKEYISFEPYYDYVKKLY